MKTANIISFLFLFLSFSSSGQSEWTVFSNTHWVRDIVTYDNLVYTVNNGGLLVIDQLTEEEQFITTEGTGLNGDDITQILMREDGHHWLYNTSTLYYSDGVNIEVRLDSFSLSNMRDQKGVLWFKGRNQREEDPITQLYSLHDGNLMEYFSAIPDGVKNIFVDSHDELWIQMDNYFAEFDGVDLGEKIFIDGINPNLDRVLDYYIDSDMRHWFCTYRSNSNYTIRSFFDGNWSSYELDSEVFLFNEFYEVESNEIVFSARDIVGRIDNGLVFIDSIKNFIPNLNDDYHILDLHHIESDSVMWISYTNFKDPTRVHRVTPSNSSAYGYQNPFITAIPQSIQKDCDGTIYCIDGDSAIKYVGGNWEPIEVRINEDCKGFRNLTLNPLTCEVWAYSDLINDCGSIWNLSGDAPEELEILSDNCREIVFDNSGNLYGLCNGQLYRGTNLEQLQLVEDIGAPHSVSSLVVGSNGDLWIIGVDEDNETELLRYDGNSWEYYDFVYDNYSSWLFEDAEGKIWFKIENGIASFDGTSFEEFYIADYNIFGMVQDPNGHYWMSSNEGLVFWDGEEVVIYNELNSDLPGNSPRDMMIVDDYLWIQQWGGSVTRMRIDNIITAINNESVVNNSFSLYPNPTTGVITLTQSQSQEISIEVFSVSGSQIFTKNTIEQEFDFFLEPGVYFVRVRSLSAESVKKVVVMDE